MGVNKWCAIVKENTRGDSKPTDDIISGEIGHGRSIGSFKGHCFDSLSIALGGARIHMLPRDDGLITATKSKAQV